MTKSTGMQAAEQAARKAGPGYEQLKGAPSSDQRGRAVAAQPDGPRKALTAEGFSAAQIDKAIGSKGR